jgi:pimeloyl-ACP methyl ester carboxylesterase
MLSVPSVRRALLGSLVYFPSRGIGRTPAAAGLTFRELWFTTDDDIGLCGWWLPTSEQDRHGEILFCHGNAGNIGDRLLEAQLLTSAGFDVRLFDYRGYGRSHGRADEQGTYRDARAARAALTAQPEADPARVIYLGESLGGAIALHLALERPPAGLILQSTFTSIRALARHHDPLIPSLLIPDWYPSLNTVARLTAPLLVLHGDRDDIAPLSHAQALYNAAPPPKRIHVFAGRGHNDLAAMSGTEYASLIAQWASDLRNPPD